MAQGEQLVFDDDQTQEVEELPMRWREKTRGGSFSGKVQLGKSYIWRLQSGGGASEADLIAMV